LAENLREPTEDTISHVKYLKIKDKKSYNHRMIWIGKVLIHYLVPTPCHGQGHLPLDQAAQSINRSILPVPEEDLQETWRGTFYKGM